VPLKLSGTFEAAMFHSGLNFTSKFLWKFGYSISGCLSCPDYFAHWVAYRFG
jgi:hypothetical protein